MPETRGATKGNKPLTEAEIEAMHNKLKDKEVRLRDEEEALLEQQKDLNKKMREFDTRREQMEREIEDRKQDTAAGGEAPIPEEIKHEIEVLRRELERLRRATSPTPRRSGQSFTSHDGQGSQINSLPESSQLPKVSFREATESVPHFDGYNIPLTQFIRACRRAKEIVPPSSERNLTKLLINKLRGRAYYAVEDEPCENITQLIDLLNIAFGSLRTTDQYRGELSAIYQRRNEHILDYISRAKDLRSAILDAERREEGYLRQRVIDDVDELTTRSFCDGLPITYRLQMAGCAHSPPFEAFALAKRLAKREEIDKQRHGSLDWPDHDNGNRYAHQPRRPTPLSRADNSRDVTRWDRDRVNHSQRNNYTRSNPALEWRDRPNRENRDFPSRYNTPAPDRRNERGNKWCRYCKTAGHEIEECRKREYNNARRADQGNATGPARQTDEPRQGPSSRPTRPVNLTEVSSIDESESQH